VGDEVTGLWLTVINENETPQNRANAQQQLIASIKRVVDVEATSHLQRRQFYRLLLPMVFDQTAKGPPGGGIYNSLQIEDYEYDAPIGWQIYYSVRKISDHLLFSHIGFGSERVPFDDPRRQMLSLVTVDLLNVYISNGYPDPPWDLPKYDWHMENTNKSLAVYSQYHKVLDTCWVDKAAKSVSRVSKSHPDPTVRSMACLLLAKNKANTVVSLLEKVKSIVEGYGLGTVVQDPKSDENLQFCTHLWFGLLGSERKRCYEKGKRDCPELDVDNDLVRCGLWLMRLWSGDESKAAEIQKSLSHNLVPKYPELAEANCEEYYDWWLKICGECVK